MHESLVEWFRRALGAFDEEPPAPELDDARLAYTDRVLAHAERVGLLERVTYPPGTRVVMHPPDGEPVELVPGQPVVTLDGDRAYLLMVAEG